MRLWEHFDDLGQAETARKRLAEVETGVVNSLDPRVALLGELARAGMGSNPPAEAASAGAEILEWTDQARYLFANVGMALLFVCRAPVVYGYPAMAGHARSACRQLQRLDKQYRTPVTAACRLEGQGWLFLTKVQAPIPHCNNFATKTVQKRWKNDGLLLCVYIGLDEIRND